MSILARVGGGSGLLAVAVIAAGCHDAVSPEHHHLRAPTSAAIVAGGAALDQSNGVLNDGTPWGPTGSQTHVGKGFDPINPHIGDAIVATFFWVGSTNNIIQVTDHLSDANQTPVGNTYNLIDYVTAGGISMATYVATSVQNFPDPNTDPSGVLAVHAIFSSPGVHGGVLLSAYTGVGASFASALGAHRSATGAGSTATIADPGGIAVNSGAVAYAVSMSNPAANDDRPTGFTNILTMSDNVMATDGEYALPASAGSVEPQWRWYFTLPSTWLASVLTLNPPGTTTPGDLTVTTSTSGSGLPASGYTATVDGTTSQPVATNGSVTFANLAAGSHTVVLSGVPGNCTVNGGTTQTITVPSGGTATAPYSVTCTTAPGNLTVTTSTSGSGLPSNGYTVTLDGTTSQPVTTNGSVTFANLVAGSHTVVLSGVPANCAVSGGTTQTITVPSGGTATASYSVSCTLPATHLVFVSQPPSVIVLSSPFTVQVAAVDDQGNTVSSYTGAVSIVIAHDASLLGNAHLSGTLTVSAVNGVATFSGLSIDQTGIGYTLGVSAAGLASAVSSSFTVVS